MALRDRLNTLRRESGAEPEAVGDAAAASAGESKLAERLERLGARDGRRRHAPDRTVERFDTATLAQELDARAISDGLLCRETVVDDTACRELAGAETLSLPGQAIADPTELVFVDTETSGLAGGAGTLAFVVGLLRLEDRGLVARQYLLTGFGGEPVLYRCLAEEAASARIIVSYNGKSFDAPLLRDRACLNRQTSPLTALTHLDLLTSVRRLYGAFWPDCRLGTAEQRLLSGRQEGDLPGEEAPLAWFGFIHRGETRRLPGVLAHNRDDIVSLARLLPRLARAHHEPRVHGADPAGTARAWQREGEEGLARTILMDAETGLGERDRLALARLARRAGDDARALRLWQELAAGGSQSAIEALAKHYEHRRRDPETALAWARRLRSDEGVNRCQRLAAKCHQRAAQGELGL